MKKNILIAMIAGISFVACKKDRTCECTDTVVSRTSTEPGYVFVPEPATKTSTKYTSIKKSNVYAQLCVPAEETSSYNDVSFTGSTTVTYVVTTVTKNDCSLK